MYVESFSHKHSLNPEVIKIGNNIIINIMWCIHSHFSIFVVFKHTGSCNGSRTHIHIIRKEILNHLGKLAQ